MQDVRGLFRVRRQFWGGGGTRLIRYTGCVPLKWVTFSQKKSLNMEYGFAEKSLNMGCSFVILL